jgi:hypothetical protein
LIFQRRHVAHRQILIQRLHGAPECLAERTGDGPLVAYLTTPEIDALLAAPDRSTWAHAGSRPAAGRHPDRVASR